MSEDNGTPENEGGENTETQENENEETLLDVISDAIDDVTPDDVLAANKEDDDDVPTDSSDTDGDPDDDAAAASADDESGNDDGADADDTAADGTDDAVTDENADADGADDESGDTAAEDAASEPDHINDPIPESTNEKTATRIKSLIDTAKDTTARAEAGDQIVQAIEETGADPEQYSTTLGFLKAYNSTDPEQRKIALQVAEGMVRELRVDLGQGTVDLLANHDDLQAEVEAGSLTQDRAIEIATSREKEALDTSRKTAADNKKTNDEAINDLIIQGQEQLTAFEATVATDPDYVRLRPQFVNMLRPLLRNAHGSTWGEVAKTTFESLKAAAPAPAAVPAPAPANTPLRAKQSAGGSTDKSKGASSALEAMDGALGDL